MSLPISKRHHTEEGVVLCDLLIRFSLSTAAILFRIVVGSKTDQVYMQRNTNRVTVSLTSVEKIRSIFSRVPGNVFSHPLVCRVFCALSVPVSSSFFDCTIRSYRRCCIVWFEVYLHNYTHNVKRVLFASGQTRRAEPSFRFKFE